MNTNENIKLFSMAITELDDRYYEEATCYERRKKNKASAKWAALVAVAAVFIGAVTLLPGHWNDFLSPSSQTTGDIEVAWETVPFNEVRQQKDSTRLKWNLPASKEVTWNAADLEAYFGDALSIPYIPEGLTAGSNNNTSQVLTTSDGSLVWDLAWLNFYHGYYEDGSPKLTDDIAETKGFTVQLSKLGIRDDYDYTIPTDQVETCAIDGVDVIFSHYSSPYGPYDPDTHQPAGYTDQYFADFEMDGITYHISTYQLDKREIVKIAASIIYGKEVEV